MADAQQALSYLVNTAHGAFQVFQTFTYGEMVISFLLVLIFLVLVFDLIFKAVR